MSTEVAAETASAIRLVALLTAVALAIYGAMGFVVTPDATLTRQGLDEGVHFAMQQAATFDRDAEIGDKPVLWVLGSSIVHEGIDEVVLQAARPDVVVKKFAFNRGGPVFIWSFLDHLDIRRGDTVVTPLHPSHFRRDWLTFHDKPKVYLDTLMDADELLLLDELPLADRLDFAVGNTPPRDFWRYREAYASASAGWLMTVTRGEDAPRIGKAPGPSKRVGDGSFARRRVVARENQLPDELFDLKPGQTNWDGVQRIRAEVEAAGATLHLVYLPSHPLLYERSITEHTLERFHEHFGKAGRYHRLPELPADHFLDYKHANFRGRAVLTDALIELLDEDR